MTAAATTIDAPTFEYVCKLVQDVSAIALEPTKAYLVESRLMPVARSRGLRSVQDLVSLLKSQPHDDVRGQVVEAMTTNETSFFRDIHPWEALRTIILPELLPTRTATKTLRVWSAACSSGQEPYTIAMLLLEHFPQLRDWNLQIFACDLSKQMVERAQQGEYSQLEVNRGLPAHLLIKYFEKSGLHWRVKPEVRQAVRFFQANLIEPWPALPTMDVVFMRNVLIYFKTETKRLLLKRLRSHVAGDGVLFLGGAETTIGIDDLWQRANHGKTSTYRLKAR